MFVQVIQGQANDREGLRAQFDRWQDQLSAGATGWLGATAGVTDDGQFVAVVRFESEEAARRNSDRPEQGEWWAETAKLFDGDPTFSDSTEVDDMFGGGSNDAGFVQVIQGRATDKARLRELSRSAEAELREARPDILGGTTAWNGDEFTDTVYFTTEAAAREGEAKELPADSAAGASEWMSLMSDLRYYDLRQPWLYGG